MSPERLRQDDFVPGGKNIYAHLPVVVSVSSTPVLMTANTHDKTALKRRYEEMGSEDKAQASPFMPMFETFRQELDEHHDRRERIIKASRDITALSKKT